MSKEGNQFQKELIKLEGLLSSLNKKNKKKTYREEEEVNHHYSGGAASKEETRFFKLISVDGKDVDGGRYELPAKTKSGKVQTRGPKDKASTAFSELCQKSKSKSSECKHKFSIQETTRGSDKKIYNYEGKRVKLEKPVILKLKDKKTGKVKEVVKKFTNIIKSLGAEHSK